VPLACGSTILCFFLQVLFSPGGVKKEPAEEIMKEHHQ
jgi:hypothetical protein